MSACQDPKLDRSVKPLILSCFADVAMALGPKYSKYYNHTIAILQDESRLAQKNTSNSGDYDEIDYMNDIREGCLDGFTGIVSALRGEDSKQTSAEIQLLIPHIQHLVQFVTGIFHDSELTDSNIRAALGLLGDIAEIFTTQLNDIMPAAFCNQCVQFGLKSNNKLTKELATYAQTQFALIRPSNQFHQMLG
jgi:importin subunit beta-1